MGIIRLMKQEKLFDQKSPPKMGPLLDGFLTHLKTEKSASPYTVLNYEIDLRNWFKFLFDESVGTFDLSRLSDFKLLRKYLGREMKKYSRATVGRRLSVIKGFLKYLHREGFLESNVAKLITLPKQGERLPFVLKPEDVIKLIEGIASDTLREKRMRGIAELLYSTGIRVSELASLTHEKIDFRAGTILVLGKGNKERVVPIGRHCQKALLDYIDSMPSYQKKGPETPLFLNREGKGLSVRSIQRNLREFAREILGPMGDKVTPHTLRHFCATHLLSRGAGLREIQELLGHQSLVTTQKYTQVDVERLKAAYEKTHPKEILKQSEKV